VSASASEAAALWRYRSFFIIIIIIIDNMYVQNWSKTACQIAEMVQLLGVLPQAHFFQSFAS